MDELGVIVMCVLWCPGCILFRAMFQYVYMYIYIPRRLQQMYHILSTTYNPRPSLRTHRALSTTYIFHVTLEVTFSTQRRQASDRHNMNQ